MNKGLCQFLNIPIMYYHAKNLKKPMTPIPGKKTPNWQTEGETTVIFRTLHKKFLKIAVLQKAISETCRYLT